MIITENKMKKAFRTNMKPSSETEHLLLEALNQRAEEGENKIIHTSTAEIGRPSERGGRGLVFGLLLMAAASVVVALVIKGIPSLHAPSAGNPGPKGEWEPVAEALVTEETDLTMQAPYTTAAPENEAEGTKETAGVEDDQERYELGDLTFTMPEIWKTKGVEIVQEEHELKAMYRGLQLCSIGKYPSKSLVGGDPLNYCAGVWYLDNETTAMLFVHNWPMKIQQGSAAVTYEAEGIVGTEYTEAEDLADILYVTTGKEYDIEELTKQDEFISNEYAAEAVTDGREFASQVIAPAISVDEEAYTFRTEYYTFTLPEPWRASPGNIPPLCGVNVVTEDNGLSIMYRGLRLCSIFIGDEPAADECLSTYTAAGWRTEKGEHVMLQAENWAQNILARGIVGPVYDENQSSDSFYYNSDYDLQDILYMITGRIWNIEEISEFKGQAENPDMSEVVLEVQHAFTDFITRQVVPMIDVQMSSYETDEYTFQMPELWKEKGASFVMDPNGLHVVYRGLTLCLIRVEPAAQVCFYAANNDFADAWEIEAANAVILYENITPVFDVWSDGWIHSDISPTGPAAAFTSDEDIADILYMYTGQEIDVEQVKEQAEAASGTEIQTFLTNAASEFFKTSVSPAVSVKTTENFSTKYKPYDPNALKSGYLRDLLNAEPYSYTDLPDAAADCQIPEEDLHALTDEELILTLLDYPYDDEIPRLNTSSNAVRYWGDYRVQAFNGFRELTEREDRDGITAALSRCIDYIVTEYGYIAPRNLLDYLVRLISYLKGSMDVPLPLLR